ncbi:hypothetical protein ACO0QE_001519 [Hanseniaspora vineae]
MSKNIGFDWGYQPLNKNASLKENKAETNSQYDDADTDYSNKNALSCSTGTSNEDSATLLSKYRNGESYNFSHNKDRKRTVDYQEDSVFSMDLPSRYNTSSIMTRKIKKNRNAYCSLKASLDKVNSESFSFNAESTKVVQHSTAQTLPINRVIELLDKEQLNNVILKLVNSYPELSETIYKECSKTNTMNHVVDSMIKKLDEKFQTIIENIPFSRAGSNNESLNDYCFERMKASLLEFLNCCYEYSQSIELGNREQWRLLDHILLQLAKLPTFTNSINNYYTNFCIEQMDKTFHKSLLNTNNDDWVYLFGDRLLKHCESLGTDRLRCLNALINEAYHCTTNTTEISKPASATGTLF